MTDQKCARCSGSGMLKKADGTEWKRKGGLNLCPDCAGTGKTRVSSSLRTQPGDEDLSAPVGERPGGPPSRAGGGDTFPCGHPKTPDNTHSRTRKSGKRIGKNEKKCAKCDNEKWKADPDGKRNRDRDWYLRNRRKKNKAAQDWQKRNPEKFLTARRAARVLLRLAVRRGLVEKWSACEICGATTKRIDGHHKDYTKPLEVEWLCSSCHGERHRKVRK